VCYANQTGSLGAKLASELRRSHDVLSPTHVADPINARILLLNRVHRSVRRRKD
jgi:hypothetical protein